MGFEREVIKVNGVEYIYPNHKVITGADPAAGVEISETVPAGKSWRLMSCQAVLVASATAASRMPALVFDNGTTEFIRSGFQGGAQVANETQRYAWARGYAHHRTDLGDPDLAMSPLPDIVLGPGFRVRTVTLAIQAGDDWGAPVFYVAEYELAGTRA